MEWQAIVLTIQILLLAVGWTLFQKARAELSARAAETPILGEVKALQKNVKQLLAEIEQTSDRTALRLEDRIETAREVLTALERRLEEAALQNQEREHAASLPETPRAPRSRKGRPAVAASGSSDATAPALNRMQETEALPPNRERHSEAGSEHTLREARRNTIYQLADAGETPAAIACKTKLTEGEVETLL